MLLAVAGPVSSQVQVLPDAPSTLVAVAHSGTQPIRLESSSLYSEDDLQQARNDAPVSPQQGEPSQPPKILPQQKRVFGVLTNYTSVSGGTRPKPAGWKTDSYIAWKQTTDYSAIGFGVATSLIAYGQDTHPLLDMVNGGNAPLWGYIWRGFLDRGDQTAQGTLFFPALLHQDTRYYAMGIGPKWKRALHAADSVVIAHSYSGRPVFNVAGLGGKVGTQAVSTTYYPTGSEDFGVLTKKFTYACLRQAGFTILREFSPDLSQRFHIHVKGSN